MGSTIAIIIFIILVILIIKRSADRSEAIDDWRHLFVDMQYSSEEFYRQVEEMLTARQIPDIEFSRKIFKEGGFTSHQREYLQISRKDHIFHICAASFGKDFFFSWWLREKLSTVEEMLMRIPVIGPPIVKRRQYKSYYHWDTDAMFRASVKETVLLVVDAITEAKGIRGLTERERISSKEK